MMSCDTSSLQAKGLPVQLIQKLNALRGQTMFEKASAALQPGAFQGKLPCREEETAKITSHLRNAIRLGGSMEVLYMSGMPGTGKTACTLEVLGQLQATKGLPSFSFVHINAMRLGTPAAVFSEIRSQLAPPGTKQSPVATAHSDLTQLFASRTKKDTPIVLLIDEIDHLATRSQVVIYRLFDWLALPSPGLVVAAISNTMDLPERLLPRVASRFRFVRLDFVPYQRDQLVQILSERLRDHGAPNAFSTTALRLCAARVAKGSGDIRKALQLCRRAVQLRLAGGGAGPVDLKHLEVAQQELLHASPAARVVTQLSLRTRRLLAAVQVELREAGEDAVPLSRVLGRYQKLMASAAVLEGGDAGALFATESAANEVRHLAERLQSMALLVIHSAHERPMLALGACLELEELAAALRKAETSPHIKSQIVSEWQQGAP